jgi:excisionase family DNA binding protein
VLPSSTKSLRQNKAGDKLFSISSIFYFANDYRDLSRIRSRRPPKGVIFNKNQLWRTFSDKQALSIGNIRIAWKASQNCARWRMSFPLYIGDNFNFLIRLAGGHYADRGRSVKSGKAGEPRAQLSACFHQPPLSGFFSALASPKWQDANMQNDELDRFFSITEAARILGWERSTIYARIKAGRLRGIRLDGSVKIPRSELVRYIASAQPLSA